MQTLINKTASLQPRMLCEAQVCFELQMLMLACWNARSDNAYMLMLRRYIYKVQRVSMVDIC